MGVALMEKSTFILKKKVYKLGLGFFRGKVLKKVEIPQEDQFLKKGGIFKILTKFGGKLNF